MIKKIKDIPTITCKNFKGIFFDIDDTITYEGKLPYTAYESMWKCKKAGLRVVPVTGRPAGWVDHMARMWPVDAIIGENGAFYFWMENNKMCRHFLQDENTRKKNRTKLNKISQKIVTQIPECQIASDQSYREIDLAIDFCEDIPCLDDEKIAAIVSLFREEGAEVKVSSIHVNGWFGNFNKMTTCRLLMNNLWNENFPDFTDSYFYCGDSPNDEPMFKDFKHSIGVANVSKWLHKMKHHPQYITSEFGGNGFAELVDIILDKAKI